LKVAKMFAEFLLYNDSFKPKKYHLIFKNKLIQKRQLSFF